MNPSRNDLHKLIDMLPESEEITAAKFLLFLIGRSSLQIEDIKAELDVRQGKVSSFNTLDELKVHLYSEE